MAGNSVFELVDEQRWGRGLGNMFRSESARWWRTRMWWVQSLIWVGILNFILGAILFTSSEPAPAEEAATLFVILAGLFPSVGVIIAMQSAMVGEKKEGTATWVLSKPISRTSFVLAKVFANSLGILVCMTLLPCLVAYILTFIATGDAWNLPRLLTALGVILINHFFFLSLTLMLGTFFSGRGPVIGIPIGLYLMQQNLIGWLPALRHVLPWNLILPVGEQFNSVIASLMAGSKNFDTLLAVVVVLESFLFILMALLRFNRQEL